MRVLAENFTPTTFTPSQRAFVESWYSLTHAQSLDAHRVRTLNARLVLRELVDVCKTVEIGVISPVNRKCVAEEAASTLDRDPIFKAKFGDHYRFLNRRLKNPECVDGKEPKRAAELRIAAEEAFLAVDPDYYGQLIAELRAAISAGRPVNEIHRLVGALLTDLTDRGFAVANLAGFHKFFDATQQPTATFENRFDYLVDWLRKPAQPHDIVLKLTKAGRLIALGTFGSWHFSASVPAITAGAVEIAFLRAGTSVAFAKTTVDARDHREAATLALHSWSRLTDQLLFDFLPRPLLMESRYRSVRVHDRRMDIGHVELRVPNPQEWNSRRDLQQFSEQLEHSLSPDCRLRAEDKRQIEAALRYFRLGTEAPSLESMFLTRWIAIESLLRTAVPDDHVAGVANSVAALMTITYLPKLNSDLCGTAKYLRRPVPGACAALADGATDTATLTWTAFAKIVQDPTARSAFSASFGRWPIYQHALSEFGALLENPRTLLAALDNHEKRVRWQMQRAYRVRNEIVHNASHSIPLLSLVAHIEYYLRTTVRTIVRALHRRTETESLKDLFCRTVTVRVRLKEDLDDAAAGRSAMPSYLLDPLQLNP